MDPVGAITVVAHAGHWFMGLIYCAPVLIVGGYIVRQNRQDRRLGPLGDDDAASLDRDA